MVSRSHWLVMMAKFFMSLPMGVEVSNCSVTEVNPTPHFSRSSSVLANAKIDRAKRSNR